MTTVAAKDDFMTVAAIGVLAMCLVTFDHEALGHGGACLALGGHIQVLTSSVFRCDLQSKWIAPAGPIANLFMGALALGLARITPLRHTGLRLFLLTVTALSFFWESGYAALAMIKQNGDLYFAGLDFLGQPSLYWRLLGGVAGFSLFVFTIRLINRALRRGWPASSSRRRIVWTLWPFATAAAVLAALACNFDRGHDIHDAFEEIGLASIPLLFMAWGSSAADRASPTIAKNWATLACAGVVFAIFVLTLGHGIGSQL